MAHVEIARPLEAGLSTSWAQYEEARRWYAERVSRLPGVQAVGAKVRPDGVVDLWTEVADEDMDREEAIAEMDCQLTLRFENLRFDFMSTRCPLPPGFTILCQAKEGTEHAIAGDA
jgi:hypothetical protein